MRRGHAVPLQASPSWLAPSLARPGLSQEFERTALAIRALVPLAALFVGGWGALLGVLVVQEAGLWVARRMSVDPILGGRVFVAAFGLRAVLAIALHAYLQATRGSGAMFQDDRTFDLTASWLVRIARGEGLAIFPGHLHFLDNFYPYLLAGVYAVLGHTPVVPKALNAALAALAAVLVLELGRRTFGVTVGRIAGVGAVVLPTLVVWTLTTLKETLIVFGIVVVLRSMQALGEEPVRSSEFNNALVGLVAGLLLVEDLRFPAFLVLGALAPLALAGRRVRRVPPAFALVAGLLAAGAVAGVLTLARLRPPDSTLADPTRVAELVRVLGERRDLEGVGARSQIGTPEDVVTPAVGEAGSPSVGRGIVDSLGFALLAPAPWQAHGLRELMAGVEMLIWYALLVGAAFSWAARPRQPLFAGVLALYGLAIWVLLALTEGNLGNLLRHRVMLAPPLLVLGGAGLLRMWHLAVKRGAGERWSGRNCRR
jgi:hypothetical protein